MTKKSRRIKTMGLRIQNNIAAMNAHRQLSIADAGLNKSLERLSSGYRINRAADDAAGLAISQQFRADIASYKVANRNTAEASSLLQVAEGAMDQIGTMLTRLKELATQAASANAGSNLDKIDAEKTKLVAEINRIANSTEYAGTKLLDGTFGEVSSTWESTGILTGEKILDSDNGLKYSFTQSGALTPTLSFTFSDPSALTAQVYTFTTYPGGSAAGLSLVGTNGEAYVGTFSAGMMTLSFSQIGLTVVGESVLATGTANIGYDTLTVTDVGLSSTSVESTTSTGTWAITSATANSVTLTNARTAEAQTVTTVDGSAQTLDFDQLGIKMTLGSEYADNDLDSLNFVVASSGSSTFQVGANNTSNDQISISVGDATTGSTGLNISALDLSTTSGAQSALDTINSAIDTLGSRRGDIGAAQNRLTYAAANLATTIENVQAAESVIRDVDMAAEMTSFTKNQILLQASTAMLAQANMAPQNILSLFGG
jgi:flagellin